MRFGGELIAERAEEVPVPPFAPELGPSPVIGRPCGAGRWHCSGHRHFSRTLSPRLDRTSPAGAFIHARAGAIRTAVLVCWCCTRGRLRGRHCVVIGTGSGVRPGRGHIAAHWPEAALVASIACSGARREGGGCAGPLAPSHRSWWCAAPVVRKDDAMDSTSLTSSVCTVDAASHAFVPPTKFQAAAAAWPVWICPGALAPLQAAVLSCRCRAFADWPAPG